MAVFRLLHILIRGATERAPEVKVLLTVVEKTGESITPGNGEKGLCLAFRRKT